MAPEGGIVSATPTPFNRKRPGRFRVLWYSPALSLANMRVTVSLEHRFLRTPDGRTWGQTGLSADFWLPYLEVFEGVRVLARVADVRDVPVTMPRADGPGVTFAAVPYYIGAAQFARVFVNLRRVVRDAANAGDAFVLRVPSPVGSMLASSLRSAERPYAVEVVGDPHDVFAPGAVEHPLRRLLRGWSTRQLRRTCETACAASYVTEAVLQRRYPCPGASFSISSIRLEDDALVREPRRFIAAPKHIVFVGSLEQLYKAPDVLIAAVARLVESGADLYLTIVGDGRFRPALETSPAARALGARLVFRGALPAGRAVREELDRADLFALPSRTEGLPRAMIEAMARGLPCVGTAVGGIPELLPREDMVPAGSVAALSTKLREFTGSAERATDAARRNLDRARGYSSAILAPRRRSFYEVVRQSTARARAMKTG